MNDEIKTYRALLCGQVFFGGNFLAPPARKLAKKRRLCTLFKIISQKRFNI